jgi:hypothetical protein
LLLESTRRFPQWRVAIEYDSKQEHSDVFPDLPAMRTVATTSSLAGFSPLTARHDDLKRGGHELVDRLITIARRAVS